MQRTAGRRRRNFARRGVALLLALIAVIMSATLGYSYLNAQGTAVGIALNVNRQTQARYIAETALDGAMAYVRATADWREKRTHGVWAADQPFAGGSYTVRGEDGVDLDRDGIVDGDGDLSAENGGSEHLLTLTATGRVDGFSHVARAVLRPVAGGDPSLIGHWKFDETSGKTASDSSGHGHTGTLQTGASWNSQGMFDGCVALDGSKGFVSVPSSTALNVTSAITLAAQIRADTWDGAFGVTANRRIMQKGASDNQFRLTAEGGSLKFDLYNVASLTADLPTTDTWVHVAATYDRDAGQMRLYYDGQLVASRNASGAIRTTNDNLCIGTKKTTASPSGYNDNFSGRIDDVRIYNRALPQDEIATLVGSRPTGPALAVADTIEIWGIGSGAQCFIDAFDPSAGAYGGTNVLNDRAVISTNATGSQKIKIGTATIRGHVRVGPGGNPASVIALYPPGQITGTRTALAAAVPMPTITFPNGMPASSGYWSLYTGTTTLNANRRVSGISLSGNSTVLRVTAPVILQVDGSMYLSGASELQIADGGSLDLYISGSLGVYNFCQLNMNTGDPGRLRIFVSDSVVLTERARLCAEVRSPSGSMEMWGGGNPGSEFFGTYVGRSFRMGDHAQFHAAVAPETTSTPPPSTNATSGFLVDWRP